MMILTIIILIIIINIIIILIMMTTWQAKLCNVLVGKVWQQGAPAAMRKTPNKVKKSSKNVTDIS